MASSTFPARVPVRTARGPLAWLARLITAASLAAAPVVAMAQVQAVDPDAAIDGDLAGKAAAAPASAPAPAPASAPAPAPAPSIDIGAAPAQPAAPATAAPVAASTAPADTTVTWRKEDLIGAAEGVFGKGARGLAEIIEDLLKKQGEPNAYIVGREGGGAFMVGLRYGSGTLHHKVEGTRPVYWTGPSLGIDAGANAGNAFVLVYNLYDTQDLFHRYGAGEGQAYLVGGFNVSYLRRKDVGLRLGANVGYMKFSEKLKWVPF